MNWTRGGHIINAGFFGVLAAILALSAAKAPAKLRADLAMFQSIHSIPRGDEK